MRSHTESNPVPYGKPSRVGHLYVTLIPSPRALRGEAEGPRSRVASGTRRWAVLGCPRTELGTEAIRAVFTLQSPQLEVDPQGRKHHGAQWPLPECPKVVTRHAQLGPDRLSASPRKISSWGRPPHTPPTLSPKTEPATAVSGHHLNVGLVYFHLRWTALPKNSWK